MLRLFLYDESSSLCLYETTHPEEADFWADIPDEIYQRWNDARDQLVKAEGEIRALAIEQGPDDEPDWPDQPPPEPIVKVEPTGPIPAARTLAEYEQAQEG